MWSNMEQPIARDRPDAPQHAGAADIAARLVMLRQIIQLVAELAGQPTGLPGPSSYRDPPAEIDRATLGMLARATDTLSHILMTGLAALQKAQRSGRLNADAARLLCREAAEAYAGILARMPIPG